MIYIHFSAMHNYVFVLLDAGRRSPNLQKKNYITSHIEKRTVLGVKKRVQN